MGSTRDVDVDVRVVATTNRELLPMVQAGLFRSDLYARLAQWTIRLPLLRKRRIAPAVRRGSPRTGAPASC